MTSSKRMVAVGRMDHPVESNIMMYRIGIRGTDGTWDEIEFPSRLTITKEEAWALAGVLSSASGLPVEGVDVTNSGDTIQ